MISHLLYSEIPRADYVQNLYKGSLYGVVQLERFVYNKRLNFTLYGMVSIQGIVNI